MARDPYKYFRIEARELLDQLNQAVLELEKATTQERVAQLMRLAHTLKGAARVVKRTDIGDLAHAIEDALTPLRGTDEQAARPLIDTLLGHLDDIGARLATLSAEPQEATAAAPESPAPASVPAAREPAAPPPPETAVRVVRVDIGEMDTLLDGFSEVHARLGNLRESARLSGDIRRQLDQLDGQLSARTAAGQARASMEQISAGLDKLNRNLNTDLEQFERDLKAVRDVAERMRLAHAGVMFGALERAVRDAAQVGNKKIVFEGRSGEIRVDAQALGAVQDALAHAARNAVAHGIETPEERRGAGKPAEGKVTIDVAQRGQWIAFTCIDDGRGIDFAAIRAIAEQKALAPPDRARTLDDEAIIQLLLRGGISTSQTVTEVSGRGIGLDAVRDTAERLGGKVELHSQPGKGTSVTMTVPLLIAALDVLLMEAGGTMMSVPIDAVRRTLRISPQDIARTAQGEFIIFDGRAIPFVPLTAVLAPKGVPVQQQTWSAVVVESAAGAVAVGVERLLGIANVILRPLPASAPARAIVSGVSLDLEGNPQLVLDSAQLVADMQNIYAPPPEADAQSFMILVIDDSLTTRMLERSILESAGYVVDVAVSAEEGLEKALQNPQRYALFLVDVEMPGMDGFTFIERVQANPDLRDIPAILVTSRAAPEDVQRGRDVGARGYVIKSEFDQGALLARIGELVK